jgi:hypothetical protein
MADKPSAMETMAVNVLSRLLGLNTEQLRAIVTNVGGGIQNAARDIADLKQRLDAIGATVADIRRDQTAALASSYDDPATRDRYLVNGSAPTGAADDGGNGPRPGTTD